MYILTLTSKLDVVFGWINLKNVSLHSILDKFGQASSQYNKKKKKRKKMKNMIFPIKKIIDF